MFGYDIIGDVHGCADKLEGLLKAMGYRESQGTYHHSERQAIFVGDLIDRGPQQIETLRLVGAMVDAKSALIVMGNHEFNAISYTTPNPEIPGEFMRPHSDKNRGQHQSFLNQVQIHPGLYARSIEWFRTWPVYLDLDGLRVVHACWNDHAISTVDRRIIGSAPMSTEFVVKANQKGSIEYEAIETLLKGPELSLTKYGQMGFMDKDDHVRTDARIRWWDTSATTLRELAEIPPDSRTPTGASYPDLPSTDCSDEAEYDYLDHRPVFYGHYWRRWEPKVTQDWTPKTACVDFSAVKGGPLVAYRWSGEAEITLSNYFKA
jgi:hypothetical protein